MAVAPRFEETGLRTTARLRKTLRERPAPRRATWASYTTVLLCACYHATRGPTRARSLLFTNKQECQDVPGGPQHIEPVLPYELYELSLLE